MCGKAKANIIWRAIDRLVKFLLFIFFITQRKMFHAVHIFSVYILFLSICSSPFHFPHHMFASDSCAFQQNFPRFTQPLSEINLNPERQTPVELPGSLLSFSLKGSTWHRQYELNFQTQSFQWILIWKFECFNNTILTAPYVQ